MSGEFGQYDYRGYIDSVIRQIAEECSRGKYVEYPMTRAFGVFLREVAQVASDIAFLEAGDNGEDSSARDIKARRHKLIRALDHFYEVVGRTGEG